jgi:hypothetical protein
MALDRAFNDAVLRLMWLARRFDPYVRPVIDTVVRPPLQALVQWILRRRLPDDGLAIAEERELPGEADAVASIVTHMRAFLARTYPPGTHAERAGNTKTYGVVRGEFTVRDDVPAALRHGLFSTPASYPAWVRLAGPGPLAPPDLHDNGIMSIGIKVMGVPGPKLAPDERFTQDFLGLSAPTFTTPDVVQNAILQEESYNNTPLFYFIRPSHPHLADLVMQGLYASTAASPLQSTYWSCVPYLLGPGQAMKYSLAPRPFAGVTVPRRPGPNYLRDAMVRTLARTDVTFDFFIQLQTDPRRMPIENSSVIWSARNSPPRPVATLRIPAQVFDRPAQLAFADVLSFNPWHSLPEHRPLGSQGRARRVIYSELAATRQRMNGVSHVEPTGEETFDEEGTSRSAASRR